MRFSTLLLPVAVVGFLAACGDAEVSSNTSTTSTTASTASTASTSVADGGVSTTAPGALPEPEVKIPATPPTALIVTDLTEGTGPAAADGDTVVVHYIGVRSADGTKFDSSYARGTPFPVAPLGQASVIDGWNQGLIGVKQGGRRQLDIPAALAYGDSPPGDIIQKGDALTFVIDVVAVIPKTNPADAPTVSVPPTPNQTESTFTDLVVGEGAAVNPGQTVVVQLIEFSAADGRQLQSSWEAGGPLSFGVDDPQIPPSLANGIRGMKVGGRRQVTVPFADAFGKDGNTDIGLPPATDLIVVIDLINVY